MAESLPALVASDCTRTVPFWVIVTQGSVALRWLPPVHPDVQGSVRCTHEPRYQTLTTTPRAAPLSHRSCWYAPTRSSAPSRLRSTVLTARDGSTSESG